MPGGVPSRSPPSSSGSSSASGDRGKAWAEQSGGERTRAHTNRAALAQIVGSFNACGPDSRRGATPGFYSAFQCLPVPSSVLELLRAQGRYHRRQEWKRHLPGWSGQDLLLRRGLDTEVEEIEARLLPVHQILATLSFGANTPRLQITVRRIRRDDLPAFGEELKYLASRVREDLTEDQARDPRPGAGGP